MHAFLPRSHDSAFALVTTFPSDAAILLAVLLWNAAHCYHRAAPQTLNVHLAT